MSRADTRRGKSYYNKDKAQATFTFKERAIKEAREAAEAEIRRIYNNQKFMGKPKGNAPPKELAPQELDTEEVEDEFES